MTQAPRQETRDLNIVTTFQRTACRPGGISRDEALENADINIERLKPLFTAWLDDELNELVRTVPNLKFTGPGDFSWIDSLDACSGRLIDVAATMGYPFVSFVAMNLRMLCEAVRKGAECRGEVFACHIDALFLGCQQRYIQMKPEDLPELAEGLRRVMETIQPKPGLVPTVPVEPRSRG